MTPAAQDILELSESLGFSPQGAPPREHHWQQSSPANGAANAPVPLPREAPPQEGTNAMPRAPSLVWDIHRELRRSPVDSHPIALDQTNEGHEAARDGAEGQELDATGVPMEVAISGSLAPAVPSPSFVAASPEVGSPDAAEQLAQLAEEATAFGARVAALQECLSRLTAAQRRDAESADSVHGNGSRGEVVGGEESLLEGLRDQNDPRQAPSRGNAPGRGSWMALQSQESMRPGAGPSVTGAAAEATSHKSLAAVAATSSPARPLSSLPQPYRRITTHAPREEFQPPLPAVTLPLRVQPFMTADTAQPPGNLVHPPSDSVADNLHTPPLPVWNPPWTLHNKAAHLQHPAQPGRSNPPALLEARPLFIIRWIPNFAREVLSWTCRIVSGIQLLKGDQPHAATTHSGRSTVMRHSTAGNTAWVIPCAFKRLCICDSFGGDRSF